MGGVEGRLKELEDLEKRLKELEGGIDETNGVVDDRIQHCGDEDSSRDKLQNVKDKLDALGGDTGNTRKDKDGL